MWRLDSLSHFEKRKKLQGYRVSVSNIISIKDKTRSSSSLFHSLNLNHTISNDLQIFIPLFFLYLENSRDFNLKRLIDEYTIKILYWMLHIFLE